MDTKYYIADKDLRMEEPVWTTNLDGVSVQRAFTIPKGSLIEVARTNAPGMAIEVYPPDISIDTDTIEDRLSSGGRLTAVEQIARFDAMNHDSGSVNMFLTNEDAFSALYPDNAIKDIRDITDSDEVSVRLDDFFNAYETAKKEFVRIQEENKDKGEFTLTDSTSIGDIQNEISRLQKEQDAIKKEFDEKYPGGPGTAPHKEWEAYDKKMQDSLDKVHDLQIEIYNRNDKTKTKSKEHVEKQGKEDKQIGGILMSATDDAAKEEYDDVKADAKKGIDSLMEELKDFSREEVIAFRDKIDEMVKTMEPQEKAEVESDLGVEIGDMIDDKDVDDVEVTAPDMDLGNKKVNDGEAAKVNTEMRGRAADNLGKLDKDGKVDKETREVFNETEKEFSLKELAQRGKSIDEQTRALQENIKNERLELENIKKSIMNLNVEAEAHGVDMKNGKEIQDAVYRNAVDELQKQQEKLRGSIKDKQDMLKNYQSMKEENTKAVFDKILNDPVKTYIVGPARNAMEKSELASKNAFIKMRDGMKSGLESIKGKGDAFAKTWGTKEQERQARYFRASLSSSFAYHKAREEMDKAKTIELNAKRDKLMAKQHKLQAKIWKTERNGAILSNSWKTLLNTARENGYEQHRMTLIQKAVVRKAERKMFKINKKLDALDRSLASYNKDIEQAQRQQQNYRDQYEKSMQKSIENTKETQQAREQNHMKHDKNLDTLEKFTKTDKIDLYDSDKAMQQAQEAYKRQAEQRREHQKDSHKKDTYKREDITPSGR